MPPDCLDERAIVAAVKSPLTIALHNLPHLTLSRTISDARRNIHQHENVYEGAAGLDQPLISRVHKYIPTAQGLSLETSYDTCVVQKK